MIYHITGGACVRLFVSRARQRSLTRVRYAAGSEVLHMMMVPSDPAGRDFVIESFLEDWQLGRATDHEGSRLRDQLRAIGDVARLERLARALDHRA